MPRRSLPLLAAFAVFLTLPVASLAQQATDARRAAIDAMYPVMIKALETGNFGQARNICDQAILWEPENPVHHYNLACIEARAGGGRLPLALAALQRAVDLGFYEIGTLKEDPDLDPIRKEPKFAGLLDTVARNAEARHRAETAKNASASDPASPSSTTSPPTTTATSATPPAPSAPPSPRGIVNTALLTDAGTPAPAAFAQGLPVGLYFMTRFWSSNNTLEKVVWYFAPDGTVYKNLEDGFSARDLATHGGAKGKAALNGAKLEVRWTDGKKSASVLKPTANGFSWDAGIFTAVKPFTADTPIAGTYEGGESLSFSGNRAAISKTLELRPDGTFRWSGVSFLSSMTDASRVSAGANGETSTGRWHAASYSLVLVDAKGNVYRRIAFPYDDEKTPVKPDRIFFGGTLFKRQESKL